MVTDARTSVANKCVIFDKHQVQVSILSKTRRIDYSVLNEEILVYGMQIVLSDGN